MRIMVVGVGALGSYFGGALAEAGHDVTLLVRNRAHRAAIREHGLILHRDGVEARIPVTVVDSESAGEAGTADIILVFTKTGATQAALEDARPVIGEATRLVSVQNGLGNAEALAAFVPMARVIYGTTMAPGDIIAPGVVSTHGPHVTQFCAAGEDAKTAAMAEDLAARLNGAGLETRVNPDVDRVIWAKVAFNCAMNSLCALLGRTPGPLLDDDEMKALVMATIMEACDVASAAGVEVDREGLRATIEMVHREHRDHKPSMLVDVENRRRTEIDALNGAVVATGARLGVPTPRNQTLLALIHGREADYTGD
ncbi:MAG: ketopantoate reductase family protein [Candidatus Puniceispirillaceae bacterium]